MATSRIPTALLAAVALIAFYAHSVWPAAAYGDARKARLSIQDDFNSGS